MATSYTQQTTPEPVKRGSTSLEMSEQQQQQHPSVPFTADLESTDGSVQLRPGGAWEVGLFDCRSSPMYLVIAIALPCVSGAYSARAIGKFPIIIGTVMGLFFISGFVFGAIWATDDHEPAFYIIGLKIGLWQNLTTGGFMNVFGITFMLRAMFRGFHRIPGSRIHDFLISFFLSCCVLAQMAEHTTRVKRQQTTHKATLQGYAA